ncbi:hypothetical protein JNW88_08215 [Micromonospora sp. ATA32]|nr:hypothetical protein [Micromonospora sp. ATA32]
MTDRLTDPTDRPGIRPAAPERASVNGHQPTTPTARQRTDVPTRPARTDHATPTTPATRPTGRLARLVGGAWGRLTYRPATANPTAATRSAVPPRPASPRPTPIATAMDNKAADHGDSSPTGKAARVGMRILLIATAVLLAVVVTAPISLSAQDLVGWAESPTGLGLDHAWAVVVFIALDAAAGVCVMLSVYCAWRGEPAGGFGVAVWVFALTSAFANYQHGSRPGAPGDAWWFFPAMSLLGPALLEMVTRKVREWVQRNDNRRGKRMPHFGWRRWIPGVGSWRDTYGAYRTANLLGIETVDLAIAWYHWLCPDGSLRVAKAMREQGVHADRLPTGTGTDVPTDVPAAPTKPATVDRSSAPTIPAQPTTATRPATVGQPTAPRPTPAPVPTVATDQSAHTPAAVANAAYLRDHYRSTGLPKLATIRADLKWSFDRANNAVKAYNDGADLAADRPDRSTDDQKEDATDARPFAHAR